MPQQVATRTGQPPGGRSDGRGRATGPSFALRSFTGVAFAALLAAFVAMRFAFESAGMRTLAPAAIALASALGSAAGLAAAAWGRRLQGIDSSRALAHFALGAAGFVVAPLLVASNRMSDAPPGSEVLFLTTAGWAAALALSGSWREGRAPRRLAGIVLACAGVAGVVANWERPSSFSIFARYRLEEALMLAAGVLWAAAWWSLDRARKRGTLAEAALASGAGAFAGSVALGISRWQIAGLSSAVREPSWWAIAGLSAAVAVLGLVLLRRRGTPLLAGAWFLPAVALTGLTAVEQAVRPFGIQPILLEQAAAGSVIAIAGAAIVAGRQHEERADFEQRGVTAAARVLAAAALASGLVALATPTLLARVSATRTDGSTFQASFTLLGLETVGGWAALGLALGAAACAFRPTRKPRALWALLMSAAAFPVVWATPLHTWSSAIPSEIQVDYGSEYASIAFSALSAPWLWLSFGGAVLSLAVLLWLTRLAKKRGAQDRGDAS